MTEGRLAPDEVRTRTFTRVVRGYKRREVRRLLERAANDLVRLRNGLTTGDPDEQLPLTPEEVEEARFQPSLGGYEMDEVDEFLDLLVVELERAAHEPLRPPSALPAPPRQGLFPPPLRPADLVAGPGRGSARPGHRGRHRPSCRAYRWAGRRAPWPARPWRLRWVGRRSPLPDRMATLPPTSGRGRALDRSLRQTPGRRRPPGRSRRPSRGRARGRFPPPSRRRSVPLPARSRSPQPPPPAQEPAPPGTDEGFFPPPSVPPSSAPAPPPPPPPARRPPTLSPARPLTPSEVETRSFERGAPGYLPNHVDLFLAKAARALAGRDGETMTRWDVLRQRFPLGPRGYATSEVDAFLVRLAAQFPDPDPAAQEEILRKLQQPADGP